MFLLTKLVTLFLTLTYFIGHSEQTVDLIGPGAPCSKAYTDHVSCNTPKTLLACLDNGDGPKCGCLEDISNLPYMTYSYSIDMEWNETIGKCMSRLDSVCNMVEGAENDILLGHLSTIPCVTGLECTANGYYPAEHGTCSAAGLGLIAMKSLILISVVGFLIWR